MGHLQRQDVERDHFGLNEMAFLFLGFHVIEWWVECSIVFEALFSGGQSTVVETYETLFNETHGICQWYVIFPVAFGVQG